MTAVIDACSLHAATHRPAALGEPVSLIEVAQYIESRSDLAYLSSKEQAALVLDLHERWSATRHCRTRA